MLKSVGWCLSVHILMHPQSAYNGRCKLDHSCPKEQGLTIKQYKFPKLWLIHTPLDSSPAVRSMWSAQPQAEAPGNHTSPPIHPLYPNISVAYWIDDPCSWSPSEFCKTAHLHNRIINTENSFNHLLCSDAQG